MTRSDGMATACRRWPISICFYRPTYPIAHNSVRTVQPVAGPTHVPERPIMSLKATIIASIGLAFFATSSWAQSTGLGSSPAPEVNSRTVRLADLDLSSEQDVKRLAFRIRVAATDVCGGNNPLILASSDFHDCIRDTMARTAARLAIPGVTAGSQLLGAELHERR